MRSSADRPSRPCGRRTRARARAGGQVARELGRPAEVDLLYAGMPRREVGPRGRRRNRTDTVASPVVGLALGPPVPGDRPSFSGVSSLCSLLDGEVERRDRARAGRHGRHASRRPAPARSRRPGRTESAASASRPSRPPRGAHVAARPGGGSVDRLALRERGVHGGVAAGLVGADRDQVLLLAQRGQQAAQLLAGPCGPRASRSRRRVATRSGARRSPGSGLRARARARGRRGRRGSSARRRRRARSCRRRRRAPCRAR